MDEIDSSDPALDDLMEDYSSLGSSSLWIWCIEYIAKFKGDVDNILGDSAIISLFSLFLFESKLGFLIGLISDVMRMAPKLPDDLGKNTNEVVALRILEYLFDPNKGQREDNPAVAKPGVEIDLSLSCHDVLQEILEEVSLSDLKPGAAALSRWNIGPFVAHKRDNLPKCALETLREEISKRKRPRDSSSLETRRNERRHDEVDREMHTSSVGRQNGSKRTKEVLIKLPQSAINSEKDDECDQENRGMPIDDVHNQEKTPLEIVETQGRIAVSIDVPAGRFEERITTGIPHDEVDSTRAIQSLNDGERDLETENHVEQNADDGPNRENNLIDEECVCVISKRDGDLLVCTGSGCSIAVHENCLKHPTQHDQDGKFLCPQCYYTLISSEYYDVMKQLPAARRKCVRFLEKLRFKGKEIMGRWGDQGFLADVIEK